MVNKYKTYKIDRTPITNIKKPHGNFPEYERKILNLLRRNFWVSVDDLERVVGYSADEVISRLRKKGHKIINEKRGTEYGRALILTDRQEENLPVEVDDCGKVTTINQKELK